MAHSHGADWLVDEPFAEREGTKNSGWNAIWTATPSDSPIEENGWAERQAGEIHAGAAPFGGKPPFYESRGEIRALGLRLLLEQHLHVGVLDLVDVARVSVPITGRLLINNFAAEQEAARRGLGLAILPLLNLHADL